MRFDPEYVSLVLNENFEDAKTLFLAPLLAIHYGHLVMLAERKIVSPADAHLLREAIDGIKVEHVRAVAYDGTWEDLFFYVEQLIVDLNADMLARDPHEILYVTGTRLFPTFRPLIERVATSTTVTLRAGHDGPGATGDEDWTRDSDQYSFIEAGIPALYVGVEDYAYHHQPTDDFESIMPDFYVGAVETFLQIVTTFDANGPVLEETRRATTVPAGRAR